jgi:hypothetical protein
VRPALPAREGERSGPLLPSGGEGGADSCEEPVDIVGHRLHAGDCCEGDQSNHQRIFDEVLTLFPLDQALHPGVECAQFDLHLRSFLNELLVLVCLGKGEHPHMTSSPVKEKRGVVVVPGPEPNQRR